MSNWDINTGRNSMPMTPQQMQVLYPTMSTNQAEAASKASGHK